MHYKTNDLSVTSIGHICRLLMAFFVLTLVVGCGKKEGGDKASQSIVRVNGDEITVLQLNSELQRANVPPAQQEEVGKQLAASMVDRQILMQEARKQKLDRNPRVMLALENAKAQILGQAYLEEKIASATKPTEAEVADYREKHSDIFTNRKVYVMEEVSFKVEPVNVQGLESLNKTAKSLEDVAQWLDAHQVKYVRSRAAHAAETIPTQLLEKLTKMVTGDLIFINSSGATVAARMLEIKDAALSKKEAEPFIERIIMDQKRKQIAEDEMKRLRGISKIEYINKKFEPNAEGAVVAPKIEGATKATESVKSAAGSQVESHIEKGLSGL